MNPVVLFEKKENCCGCGACLNICPRSAITMCEDEYGFTYPHIDVDKCISCGMCKTVCAYQNKDIPQHEKQVYAATTKDDELVMKSSSGGIFAQMAKLVLDDGGVVFGCSLEHEGTKLTPKQIGINSQDKLYKLQGSKYVQSDTKNTYKEAKELLNAGKIVLYSGTPCQIHGLRTFLGKEYQNLIAVDIICHGVPSRKMFNDYISYYEKKFGGSIVDYKFRDKKNGQIKMQRMQICRKDKAISRYKIAEAVGYTWCFYKSYIFRENCYSCKYAQKDRVSDITLGDFWGVCSEHGKELQTSQMDGKKGISCLILNTEKGKSFFDKIKDNFYLLESDIDKVARHNGQLNHPSLKSVKRQAVMEMYKQKGYAGVHKFYKKDINIKILYYYLLSVVPKDLKSKLRSFLKK